MLVDQVVVVSLARRVDRRRQFWRGLPRPWPLPLPVVVEATPGGVHGCLLSHLGVLDRAIAAGVGSLLVLEDDAVFVAGFAQRWAAFTAAVPADWQMLMVGGQHAVPPLAVGLGVVRCVDTFRTHAYVVRAAGMTVLREVWASAQGHLDHESHRVQAMVPVYAPQPFLVGQAAGFSDVSNAVQSRRFW